MVMERSLIDSRGKKLPRREGQKKLTKVIVPDKWKEGASNTTEGGGRKINENKLLSKKNRFIPTAPFSIPDPLHLSQPLPHHPTAIPLLSLHHTATPSPSYHCCLSSPSLSSTAAALTQFPNSATAPAPAVPAYFQASLAVPALPQASPAVPT
ncbi:hypothetical protein HHK36_032649 [Tetracentron sinense]|uniref:Cysteine-rich PDZ-binding protein n=1 Tax=Tetracentron sinense TaxID=13715 RepID=A0A834Y725_TETSI|nr:hypothetical protein HHK36_032649 [Tetracentron sinense]